MIRVWPGVKGAITFIYILGMGKRVGVDQKGLDRGKNIKTFSLKDMWILQLKTLSLK